MALIQLELGVVDQPDLRLKKQPNYKFKLTKDLMEDKNHDYGEAWRNACKFTN
jgi:hypothetical protein